MLNRLIVFISFVFALVSCEEPAPLTPGDLIDDTLVVDTDFDFSAYVDVFPLRANNVSFSAQADNTYKIVSRDVAKSQRIEISLPEIKVGAYNIKVDSTMTLKFFSEIKEVFSSETDLFPSDFIFIISDLKHKARKQCKESRRAESKQDSPCGRAHIPTIALDQMPYCSAAYKSIRQTLCRTRAIVGCTYSGQMGTFLIRRVSSANQECPHRQLATRQVEGMHVGAEVIVVATAEDDHRASGAETRSIVRTVPGFRYR